VALFVVCVAPTTALAQKASSAAAEDPTPEERGLAIAREVSRRTTGYADYEARLTMTLLSRDGKERVRELDVSVLDIPDDGERTLLVFRSPRDLAGTSLLTHAHESSEDDQWLYLPAMKRVKRVSGASRSGSFMGSEFAYEDVSSEDVGNFTYRYEGEERIEDRAVDVVDRFPLDPGSGYSRQRVYVDRQARVPLRIDYFDARNEILKTLTFTDYEAYGPYRRAGVMTMENQRTGALTRLEWAGFRFDADLSERRFTPDALSRRGG
jgi:outer membrane lipoprotein-sorting protein